MHRVWYVYIITNYTNSVFYTGVTNNLEKRVWEHKHEVSKNSFSAKYRLYKLIWLEEFSTPFEAIEAEKKVKDYRREKKLNLIKSKNPNFMDLSTRG
ncbi:MAG: GIY-YIG nuclease family protein [Candidatus Levybacteria bacterium]|nr:GIY-YIG nuclease family protein [Candidatus Levybacteria bacterium]